MIGRSPASGSRAHTWQIVLELAAAPRLNQALAVSVFLAAFGTHATRSLIGEPGALAALVVLDVLAALSLLGQRERIEWHGILPISLLAFFGWISLSVLWSQYTWATVGGIAYAFAYGVLGLYLALGRDVIQVMRAAGDALRILLVGSLIVEVLSGLLLDVPFPFLGVQGHLGHGGPIQGLVGNRNLLGFLSLLALITFLLELLTKSVSRNVAIGSLVLASITLVLTRSPVSFAATVVIALALLALGVLRRSTGEVRRWTQVGLLGFVAVSIVFAGLFRHRLAILLNAASDIEFRAALWSRMAVYQEGHTIEGLGWVGPWHVDIHPFRTVGIELGRVQQSGLSAYVDAGFQVGVVGMLILAVACSLAFWRAWVIASTQRSKTHVWPALVLLLLIITSFAESYLLSETGLMLLVAIGTTAAHRLSWRHRLK